MLSTIVCSLFIFCVVLVVTLLIFQASGVTFRNYGTFKKLMRLKRANASATAAVDVLFDHVMKERAERGAKSFDVTYIGIFDAGKQDDVLNELIGRLLENDVKPIFINRRNGGIKLVQSEPSCVECPPDTM